jgi:hypothetical protein
MGAALSLELLRTLGYRKALIGVVGLVLLLLLLSGPGILTLAGIAALAILAYFVFKNLRTAFYFKAYRGAWRYGAMVGGGLLIAIFAAWAFLGWASIMFVLGALAVSLLSYAIILSLQRMSLPNSVINVTTDVRLRAPFFRKWGRYVLKAELKSEIATAKGKTRQLHTKRIQVKVHKDDFPEGRLVESCHQLVHNFVEKERQLLLKAYPQTQLVIDNSYHQQVKRIPVPVSVKATHPAAGEA